LSDAEAEAQARELIGAPDWRKKIERSGTSEGAKVKNTAKNAVLILTGVFGSDVFIKNDFKHLVLYGRAVPWGRKPGDELSNDDLSLIGLWFADNWRVEPSKDKLLDAIIGIAANNRFHPVRDYLDGLKWDGVPRAENWLKKHLGATGPKEYLASVSLKTLVAMVARIYEPGIKFDCVLILQGRQGVGKSRAVQAIAGDDWFSDAPINLHDKDGVLSMRSTWVMELGELAGMRKSDVDQLKEFLSRRVDRIRPPYGRLMEAYPRQCIFIGTTNNSEYLKDPTGGRRFWPVEVGECDVDGLSAERDQLLAEAKAYYALGENLWLDNDKARAQSEIEQEARMHADEWVNVLAEFFEKDAKSETPLIDVDKFKLCDLFGGMGPLAGERMDVTTQMRVGTCLRQLGYDKADLRINGRVCKVWTRVAPTVAPKSKTGATENVQ
jgi:putative DNA primase/helicase